MSTLAIYEAFCILQNKGYRVVSVPTREPGHYWIGYPLYDELSKRDLLVLAQALRDHIRCAFCGGPAEFRCPICGAWICEEDQRRFPPTSIEGHFCLRCTYQHNLAQNLDITFRVRALLLETLDARIESLQEEAEWNAIASSPHVLNALRRMAVETKQNLEIDHTERAGGIAMAKYKRRSLNTAGLDNQYVEAVQAVQPQTIETTNGRTHVMAGDWIVTYDNGQREIMRDEVFKQFFKKVQS